MTDSQPAARHSPPGAMSPMNPEFTQAITAAGQKLLDAVLEFERATGRIVDGISLSHYDVTRICDPQPMSERVAHLSWLPMPGEFGSESATS